MKHQLAAALLIALTTVSHADSSKFNPQDLRRSFVSDCEARGLSKGADPDQTYKFCTCTFDTLATNLTVGEYLEVDRLGRTGGKPELLPQMQRVIPKLRRCSSSD